MARFIGQAALRAPNMRVDFSPLERTIDGFHQQRKENEERSQLAEIGAAAASGDYTLASQKAFAHGKLGVGSQFQGIVDRRTAASEAKEERRKAAQSKRFGNQALIVMREKDPAKQTAMWSKILARHPNAAQLGDEYRDPRMGAALLLAESGMAKDLISMRQGDARLNLQREQMGNANRRHRDNMDFRNRELDLRSQPKPVDPLDRELKRERIESMRHSRNTPNAGGETTFERESAKLTAKDQFATKQLQDGGRQVLRMVEDLARTFKDPNISSVIGPFDSRTPDVFSSSRTLRGKINQGMQAINSTMQRTLLKGGGSITESERASIDKIQGDLQSARSTEEVDQLMGNYRQILGRIFRLDGESSAPKDQSSLSAPSAGAVEDGYRFKGGDPANPDNWESAQ